MEYFFTFLVYLFFKVFSLIPLVLILIGLIKLYKKRKTSAISTMLTGNIGLLVKLIVIDSLTDYLLRFSSSLSVSNASTLYSVTGFIAVIFSLVFALGFLLFINDLVRKETTPL